MVEERPKKKEDEKSKLKPVSITSKDVGIIEDKLSNYGEFSGYVRFCLRDEEQISKFKEAKKNSAF